VAPRPYRVWKWMQLGFALLARLRDPSGAEIVEFVVSLPLLIVTVVGVFDFGSAFIVRQKVINAVQVGARVASKQPTTDLSAGAASCSAPSSICVLLDVIDTTLKKSGLNDCGLASAAAQQPAPPNPVWTFTANTGCPGTLTLTIERGCVLGDPTCAATTSPPVTSPPFPTTPYLIEATRITISYPYRWEFNRVISLLVGASWSPSSQITSVAIMQNLN